VRDSPERGAGKSPDVGISPAVRRSAARRASRHQVEIAAAGRIERAEAREEELLAAPDARRTAGDRSLGLEQRDEHAVMHLGHGRRTDAVGQGAATEIARTQERLLAPAEQEIQQRRPVAPDDRRLGVPTTVPPQPARGCADPAATSPRRMA